MLHMLGLRPCFTRPNRPRFKRALKDPMSTDKKSSWRIYNAVNLAVSTWGSHSD